jgi:hypothetical protein
MFATNSLVWLNLGRQHDCIKCKNSFEIITLLSVAAGMFRSMDSAKAAF